MDTLLKYLRIVIKYRRFIFYNVLIFTTLGVILSFILPQKFQATGQLLPPPEDSDFIGSLATTGLSIPRLSRLARAGGFFRGSTPSDLIGAILESRTIKERVIEACDLMKVYKIKKSIELAVKTLSQATKLKITEEGVVRITVEAGKPKLAADIVNSYISELDRFLKESNMSRGKNMRIFIEKRLANAEQEFKTTQESLKVFQERNRVVALDEETKAVIETYAKLKSELLKREIELGVFADLSSQDNPYLNQTKMEINEFSRKLADLERGKSLGKGFGAGFSVPFQKLPEVAAEYARRLRDYKVQEEIYALLVQQYEQAKILEARDTPNITILDHARVPERRSSPKRKIIVGFAFAFSLVFSLVTIFGLEYWKNLKENPQQYQEMRNYGQIIKEEFRAIKKLLTPKNRPERKSK